MRVAARMVGISHARAYLIWGLYRDIGARAFEPRSSRPQHIRRQTPPRLVRRIEQLRRRERIGPRAIGWALGLARSTVYAVLRRLGLGHLKVFRERRSFRRYERHFRARGEAVRHRRLGYVYEHALVDDRTRTSYRETLPTEAADDAADFLERGLAHFAGLGVSVRQLMSDNHMSYTRGRRFAEILARRGITHITIPAYTPRWNGKVEAFIKILLREVAYARPYRSEAERERAFRRFDHHYNFVRRHGEIGGLTPMQRLADDLVNNVPGQNS